LLEKKIIVNNPKRSSGIDVNKFLRLSTVLFGSGRGKMRMIASNIGQP